VRDAKIVGIVRLCTDPREELGVLWIVPCFGRNNILAGIGRPAPSKTENGYIWLLSNITTQQNMTAFPAGKGGAQLPM
jgi:hypothetical protein